jgi:hypothetical protein
MNDERPNEVLSREVVSLVHYVELNRSGWWNRALDQLVLVALWILSPTTPEGVISFLDEGLDHRINRNRVEAVIERELDGGSVLMLTDGRIKVAEEVCREYEAAAQQNDVELRTLQERFQECADALDIVAPTGEMWRVFETEFVGPLVQVAGARLYEIISYDSNVDAELIQYGKIIDPLIERYGSEYRELLVNFLDPKVPEVRRYVLHHLNAGFVREAAALDSDVISMLQNVRSRPERVRVIIDTNFVFSFLGLSDDPKNNVATDLVELAKSVRDSVAVDFYILPITVREVRSVLRSSISRLEGVRPQRNMAIAIESLGSNGLVTAFFRAAAEYTGGVLTSEMYFGPYEANLVSILKEKGIELLNEKTDELHVDQEVIDDLHSVEKGQQLHRKKGPKSYEANLHDMVLWHFANRRRPASIESPLDAVYWICTLDLGLVSFDRRKRRGKGQPPICVQPSLLIQMIQFWAPRSTSMDVALVGIMREPLMLLPFDRASESATLEILKTLSRFEGVQDLSPTMIVNLLKNDALRSTFDAEARISEEESIDLVEAAMMKETLKADSEREKASADRKASAREAEKLRALLASEQQAKSEREIQAELLQTQLEESKESLRATLEALEHERDLTTQKLAEVEARRQASLRLAQKSAILAIAASGCFYLIDFFCQKILTPWIASVCVALLGLFVYLFCCETLIRHEPHLEALGKRLKVKHVRLYCGQLIVLIVVGVFVSALVQGFHR